MDDAHDQVSSLGANDLRLILAGAGLPAETEATATDLATTVLLNSDDDSLVYLREFLRRRSDSIRHAYDTLLPSRIRSAGSPLKPFTRLLILYAHSAASLKEIFFLHLWQSNRTSFALDSNRPLPASIPQDVERASDALAHAISKAWSGREVKMLGTHTLQDGTSVFVFNREYSPSIQRDFREQFNLHFRCGLVVFGFPPERKSLFIKCGNSQIAEALRCHFQGTYSVKLSNRLSLLFSNFDPQHLAARLLGDIPADSPVTVVAARFRRSALPSHSSFTLSESGSHASIEQDLKHLAEAHAVALHSLDELEQLVIDFHGRSAEVDFSRLPGGAIRIKLNDSGWDAHAIDELRASFQAAFTIPLDCSIDPRRLALGSGRIVTFLLNMNCEDELQGYQREQFKLLVQAGLLVRTSRRGRKCVNSLCRLKTEVSDPTADVCDACDQPLGQVTIREVTRDSGAIATFVKETLAGATNWKLQSERQFEGQKYFPLVNERSGSSEEIAVLFRDRLTSPAKLVFQRSCLPLIMVHTNPVERGVYLGPDNIGYLDLAYLFVAGQDVAPRASRDEACRRLLRSLLIHYKERIATAARHSYEHLIQGTAGDAGNVYETDVFNVLREVFGYCYQIGREGRAEPDGYVCVPIYGSDGARSLDDVESWNWTYDAKHSDAAGGYDLSIGERRKMVDYINAIRRNPGFMGHNRRLRAHVIISNNMRDDAMGRASQFVFGPSGVRPANRDVRLILMRQEFVTRLYELFGEKREELKRRIPLLGEFIVGLMDVDNEAKFIALGESQADGLVSRLLDAPEVEATVTYEELIRALDAQSTRA